MRQSARRYGREIHCNRNLINAPVTSTQKLPEIVLGLEKSERSVLMQWISRQGPFWEENRLHAEDEYLECAGAVVTDTALGEAAYGNFTGGDNRLASLEPSSFVSTPLDVALVQCDGSSVDIPVVNYWRPADLHADLAALPPLVASWRDLEEICRRQFSRLTFSADCFLPLRGHPFVLGASRQILAEIDVLNRFADCFNDDGTRSAEGQRLYQDHFTGEKAWFTDSTDQEKVDFENELLFSHPTDEKATISCPWHGKVKWPQIRIHFSSPIRYLEPVYIVYIGPKLTKR
jgi:hypothetical protein